MHGRWFGVVLYGRPGVMFVGTTTVMFVGTTAGRPNILFFVEGNVYWCQWDSIISISAGVKSYNWYTRWSISRSNGVIPGNVCMGMVQGNVCWGDRRSPLHFVFCG